MAFRLSEGTTTVNDFMILRRVSIRNESTYISWGKKICGRILRCIPFGMSDSGNSINNALNYHFFLIIIILNCHYFLIIILDNHFVMYFYFIILLCILSFCYVLLGLKARTFLGLKIIYYRYIKPFHISIILSTS